MRNLKWVHYLAIAACIGTCISTAGADGGAGKPMGVGDVVGGMFREQAAAADAMMAWPQTIGDLSASQRADLEQALHAKADADDVVWSLMFGLNFAQKDKLAKAGTADRKEWWRVRDLLAAAGKRR